MHIHDPAGPVRLRRAVTATLLGAALATSVVPPAHAAETRTRSAFADTTKPVMFLKETVVTGARYPRAYYESPQSLSFVSRLQLREQSPTVLGDVLATIPGVESNKDSPWEQRPVVRGMSGQRVLVLVDGNPMNSVRGNGPHPSLLDPSQVERIEVVRGPSSVAYGSDAIGGVINIITREAGTLGAGQFMRGSASVGGSVGGLPERNGSLDFSARHGRFSAFVAGGGRKTDDFKNADGEVAHSSFNDWNALTNLRYDLTERLALKGGYQLYRGRNIGIPGLDFAFPGASQIFQFSIYDRDYAHLTLEHHYPSSGWLANTHISTYWQREHRNFFSDQTLASYMYNAFGIPPRGGSSSVRTLQDRFFDLNTHGFQVQMTSNRTEHYRFSAGVDGARDMTGGDNRRKRTYYDAAGAVVGSVGLRTTASVPTGRFDNYAGFLQGEFFMGPQWTVNLGGRYTRYRYRTDYTLMQPGFAVAKQNRDDDALSGSLGVVYTPVKDLHLTANVANGYREPNAQDLFFSGPGSVGFVMGNPELKPERSVSYDAGLRWGPGTLAISGNVFYSTFEDLINALPVAPPPEAQGQNTYQYTNITTARMWGGEAEAEWHFHPQWTARTSLSGVVGDITSREAILTIYGVNTDKAPLELVPPFGGSASLRWTESERRWWVEAGTRYSWRTNRLPLVTPGAEQLAAFKKEWIVGDVSAGARFGSGQRAVLGVRNVTDRRYRLPLGSVVEPGATFFASLSSDF